MEQYTILKTVSYVAGATMFLAGLYAVISGFRRSSKVINLSQLEKMADEKMENMENEGLKGDYIKYERIKETKKLLSETDKNKEDYDLVVQALNDIHYT